MPPDDTRPRSRTAPAWLVWCLGALSSLCVALWQAWPLPREFTTQLPRGDTDPLFHTWAIHAWHVRWAALQLWPPLEANNFFPHAHELAFSDLFLGQALVSFPAFLLGAEPVVAHNVAFLAMYAAMPMGAFAAAWWLTRSVPAALVALAGAALAQHRATTSDHLNIMSGFLLAPLLAKWALWWRRPTVHAGVILGLLYGFQWWFCGQVAVLASLAFILPVGAASALRVPRLAQHLRLRALLSIAAFLAVAGVLAGPIALGHQAATAAIGQVRTLQDNISYAVEWREYLNVHGTSALQRWIGRVGGFAIYPGAVLMALALTSLVKPRRAPLTVVLAGVAVVSFVLSLGPVLRPGQDIRLPYYYLYDLVSPLRGIRTPGRFVIPLQAALALLAALAVARLARSPGRRWAALAWIFPVLVAWDLAPRPMRLGRVLERSYAMEAAGRSMAGMGVTEIPDGRPDNFSATWRSIFHQLNTTAGTSGATPPLTGALRCRSNRFPLPESVDVLQAAGVGLVAVHSGSAGFVREILAIPQMPGGITRLPLSDSVTTIFELPKLPQPKLLDASLLRGHQFPLILPSAVPPHREVHAAVDLAAIRDGTRVSTHPALRAQVELSRNGNTSKSGTTLHLPAVLDSWHHLATFSFVAPNDAGPWTLRLFVDGELLGEGTFEVTDIRAAHEAGAVSGVTLEVDPTPWRWLAGRCGAAAVRVHNRGNVLLTAYAQPTELPPERGRLNAELTWLRQGNAQGRHRAHQWQRRQALLWHDLGPGQDGEATVEFPAPPAPGTYELRVSLSVEHGPPLATTTVPNVVVETLGSAF